MPFVLRSLCVTISVCLATICLADPTRVLFVGNSYIYSNDLPGMFRTFSASLGETVETGLSAPGGYTFALHTTNATTQSLIAEGNWDFVVLQEQSQLPSFSPGQVANEVFPYAAQLVQQVHAANACAEVVFMMTWGRENGDASNCASYPPVCTYAGMQQRLRDSYVQMASDNASWVGPVGAVWREFRAISPVVIYSDGSHPNMTGTYIAATTLFSTMFRRSCESASFEPAAVQPADALVIRGLASSMVADSSSTWNIGINDPVAQFSYMELGNGVFAFENITMEGVMHNWSFGDGVSSTDQDPQHTYVDDGVFEVSLISIDQCGRADTATMEITVLSTSIEGSGIPISSEVLFDASQARLVVNNSGRAGRFEIMDVSGRMISNTQLVHGSASIALRKENSGAYFWQMIIPGEPHSTGRFVMP